MWPALMAEKNKQSRVSLKQSALVSSDIMEALKSESVNRRSSTSRRTPSTPHAGASQDLAATNHLFRAPDWRRRAGEWSHWGGLGEGSRESGLPPHRQQTARTQHARRPASCIEGARGMDGWLQQLEEMQRRRSSAAGVGAGLGGYSSGSGVPLVPPLSDRTVSMPVLPDEPAAGRFIRHTASPSSLYSEDLLLSLTDSLSATPLGSDESLWPPDGAGSSETVSIRETPRAEYTSMSSLTAVKIGWLPIQRRLVVENATSHTHQPHTATQSAPCQVKMKPPITPVFTKSAVKPNGFGHLDGAAERCYGRPATAPVKTCVPPGPTAATSSSGLLVQSASREQRAPVERDAGSPQPWRLPWRAWPERRESPAWVDSSGRPTLPRSSCTPPPSETPRPALHNNPARAKPGFSSITITSRKVTRSASLPESGTSSSPERPRSASPAGSMSRSAGCAAVPLRRRAVVVKMTDSRVTTSSTTTGQGAGLQRSPQTAFSAACSAVDLREAYSGEPVVLRRKATIVKVTEESESYRLRPVPGEGQTRARRSEVRYSYTEGLQPMRYTSDPPSLTRGGAVGERIVPKLHRSTLSLHVTTAPCTDPPGGERVYAGRSSGSRRPVSFHAGMCSHSQPALESFSDLLPRGERPGLPRKTDMAPSHLTSSKVSLPAGPVRRDAGHPEARTLRRAQELTQGKPLPGAIYGSLPPPTLINSSDSSSLTPDTILAHNAAAIIANIKLQRQHSKKKTSSDSSETGPQTGPSRREAVEDAGNPGNPQRHERDEVRQDCTREGLLRRPYAEFVPLSLGGTQEASSLREALRLHRPSFISRSEARVQELQSRAQQRRQQQQQDRALPSTQLPPNANHTRAAHTRTNPHSDNLFKSRDRAVTGRETQHRSRRSHVGQSEMKRRREEEKRKSVSLTNRLRVDIFKKKLLDQLLHRGTD
ncbi:(E2-independent) E3 ubiquitin-conjugating enzyme FATS [Alosa pseudoharengus]|uniref:(E2-independent) E3 ubiquitin-conjugating enzyme FATS n=1 Tax=Alosa pseudoharengus TaxID=34774 RepID=UPI003F88949C